MSSCCPSMAAGPATQSLTHRPALLLPLACLPLPLLPVICPWLLAGISPPHHALVIPHTLHPTTHLPTHPPTASLPACLPACLQENRLTQERIDSALGAELLGRVVFYGQSDITALLEVCGGLDVCVCGREGVGGYPVLQGNNRFFGSSMLHRTPLYFIVLHCTSLYFPLPCMHRRPTTACSSMSCPSWWTWMCGPVPRKPARQSWAAGKQALPGAPQAGFSPPGPHAVAAC